ncbi:hypothetical protein Tco_1474940 [Tanacetum coccineum]
MDKSRSYLTHDKHQELYNALLNSIILDEAIARGDVNQDKVLRKKDYGDDQDPSARSDQGKEKKMRKRTNAELSKKSSTSKESSKGKTSPKTSKIGKSVTAEEPIEEPIQEYNIDQCYLALTDQLDWAKPEGERCPYDLTKPLPLTGRPGHLTIPVDQFFNNDLEFLRTCDTERKYTTSITKTKVARYELVGIKDMIPRL